MFPVIGSNSHTEALSSCLSVTSPSMGDGVLEELLSTSCSLTCSWSRRHVPKCAASGQARLRSGITAEWRASKEANYFSRFSSSALVLKVGCDPTDLFGLEAFGRTLTGRNGVLSGRAPGTVDALSCATRSWAEKALFSHWSVGKVKRRELLPSLAFFYMLDADGTARSFTVHSID